MIVGYDEYRKARNFTGKDQMDKAISDLARLKESCPTAYDMYDQRYQREQEQARQTRQQTQRKSAGYLTYSEYVGLLDSVGSNSLMGENDNLRRISQFSREHPREYQDYRQRLRNEIDGNKGVR